MTRYSRDRPEHNSFEQNQHWNYQQQVAIVGLRQLQYQDHNQNQFQPQDQLHNQATSTNSLQIATVAPHIKQQLYPTSNYESQQPVPLAHHQPIDSALPTSASFPPELHHLWGTNFLLLPEFPVEHRQEEPYQDYSAQVQHTPQPHSTVSQRTPSQTYPSTMRDGWELHASRGNALLDVPNTASLEMDVTDVGSPNQDPGTSYRTDGMYQQPAIPFPAHDAGSSGYERYEIPNFYASNQAPAPSVLQQGPAQQALPPPELWPPQEAGNQDMDNPPDIRNLQIARSTSVSSAASAASAASVPSRSRSKKKAHLRSVTARDTKYPLILPKTKGQDGSGQLAICVSYSGQKQKRPRNLRNSGQTAETRKVGICVPCHVKHIRCDPDLEGCETCRSRFGNGNPSNFCVRARIKDINAFRKTNSWRWEHRHPLFGDGYGDFDKEMTWLDDTRKIWITHADGGELSFNMRRFDVNGSHFSVDLSDPVDGVFQIPFAFPNEHDAAETLRRYIDDPSTTLHYCEKFISGRDRLYQLVFDHALKWAFRKKSTLVQSAIRFWVAARFLDGGMKVVGNETPGLPPSLCYQILALLMNDILPSFINDFTKDLDDRMAKPLASRETMWLEVMLASFIILTSIQMNFEAEVPFARTQKYSTKYANGKVIEEFLLGAENLLVHFHYYFNQHRPLAVALSGQGMRAFRGLDVGSEGIRDDIFLGTLLSELECEHSVIEMAGQGTGYETRFFFVGQLFSREWRRQTRFENPVIMPHGRPAYVASQA